MSLLLEQQPVALTIDPEILIMCTFKRYPKITYLCGFLNRRKFIDVRLCGDKRRSPPCSKKWSLRIQNRNLPMKGRKNWRWCANPPRSKKWLLRIQNPRTRSNAKPDGEKSPPRSKKWPLRIQNRNFATQGRKNWRRWKKPPRSKKWSLRSQNRNFAMKSRKN